VGGGNKLVGQQGTLGKRFANVLRAIFNIAFPTMHGLADTAYVERGCLNYCCGLL